MPKRVLTLLFVTLAACSAQATGAADPVFQDFLAWYKNYKGSFVPEEATKAYAAKLSRNGMSKQEIDNRLSAVWKGIGAMPVEFAALHFDHIYMAPAAPFKTEASGFLARAIEGRKPGRALDVAMGQGRNALFLASKGWDVSGYDISGEGLAIAQANAARQQLKINTVLASHESFDYGVAQWDLVVETFAFTNLADPEYRGRVIRSLRPGGLLVIEGFGNPEEPGNGLIEAFKELRILHYEDRDDVADWSMRRMRLNRLTAEKR